MLVGSKVVIKPSSKLSIQDKINISTKKKTKLIFFFHSVNKLDCHIKHPMVFSHETAFNAFKTRFE